MSLLCVEVSNQCLLTIFAESADSADPSASPVNAADAVKNKGIEIPENLPPVQRQLMLRLQQTQKDAKPLEETSNEKGTLGETAPFLLRLKSQWRHNRQRPIDVITSHWLHLI